VTAVFGSEEELTLFMRMCAKEIAKTWRKYIPTEEFSPATLNRGRRSEWRSSKIFANVPKSRLSCHIAKILFAL